MPVSRFCLHSIAPGPAPLSAGVGPSCRTMEQNEISQTGFAWRLACAAIAPFIVESGYLFLSRWPSYRFTTFSDYAGFVVSIFAGAAFVAILPIKHTLTTRWRAALRRHVGHMWGLPGLAPLSMEHMHALSVAHRIKESRINRIFRTLRTLRTLYRFQVRTSCGVD